MALKTWIDEVKKSGSGLTSEAQLEQSGAEHPEKLPGEDIADQIYFSARDRILSSGVFYRTPAAAAAVEKVNQTYKDILSGGTDFEAMHSACEQWVNAATKPPEEIENETMPGV